MVKGRSLALTAIVVVAIVVGAFIMIAVLTQGPAAFKSGDMVAPEMITVTPSEIDFPSPTTSYEYGYNIRGAWSITPVYEVYGGVVNATIENIGMNTIFIYGYGWKWVGSGEEYWRNCSVTIGSDHFGNLGMLYFEGPEGFGNYEYRIMLKIFTASASENQWCDRGTVNMLPTSIEVLEVPPVRDSIVTVNPHDAYNNVNERIDTDAVEDIVASMGDDYDTLTLFQIFDWVYENIDYRLDPTDIWQSASETLSLGYGDCEDHAILIASMIRSAGGNARVNIIQGHAFPTVYIGDEDAAEDVRGSVRAYYGTDVPVHYLIDDLGYWLVMDTNGFPYPGGLASSSSPILDADSDWCFPESDFLYVIDVTGLTYDGPFGFL